jgi:MazG family protein
MSDPAESLRELLELMARLRDPRDGCPWDRAQSFATIAPYTLEEAYEVADAIDSGDGERLKDELGDLLFQVVFHARMAEERGWFDFAGVAATICDKLVRRHPHVFGSPQAQLALGSSDPAEHEHAALWRQWEQQKEHERLGRAQARGETAPSVLSEVPLALPALTRAAKLGKRAARVGFDWPDGAGVRRKLTEELAELDAELSGSGEPASTAQSRSEAITEELGDLLFTVANLARHLQVDPENALRAANGKFERRFRSMERRAAERGRTLRQLSAQEWDELWEESKRVQ